MRRRPKQSSAPPATTEWPQVISYRQQALDDRWDAIVIGSGLGGLTTAALLSKYASRKVLVLERHYTAGGYTHSFRRPGYSLNYAEREIIVPLGYTRTASNRLHHAFAGCWAARSWESASTYLAGRTWR